jgi:hypothetical protein
MTVWIVLERRFSIFPQAKSGVCDFEVSVGASLNQPRKRRIEPNDCRVEDWKIGYIFDDGTHVNVADVDNLSSVSRTYNLMHRVVELEKHRRPYKNGNLNRRFLEPSLEIDTLENL